MIMITRKKLLYILLLAILAPLIVLGFKYLNSGQLSINTDDQTNTVYIKKVDDRSSEVIKEAQGNTSVRLPAGEYMVEVENNSVSVSQIVKVKRLQDNSYTLNPPRPAVVEPVLNQAAFDVSVSSSALHFVDYENKALYRVDKDNHVQQLHKDLRFNSVDWISPRLGVGGEEAGKLYQISDGLTELALPTESDFTSKLIFSASDSDNLYFSNGKVLYAGGLAGGYQKIYESESSAEQMVLRAGKGKVLLLEIEDFEEGENPPPKVKIISKSGEVESLDIEAPDAEFSDSGKRLVLNTGDRMIILDENFKELVDIPSSPTARMQWVNDSRLIYSLDDRLMSFDLDSKKSDLIANAPLAGLIYEISMDDSKNYAYIITGSGESQNLQIKRVSIEGYKPISEELIKLQDIMPLTLSNCLVDLVNFTYPVITALPLSSPTPCTDQASAELTALGINQTQLQIRDIQNTNTTDPIQ